jgi:hypothetical protein
MNIELAGTFGDGLDGELHQGCRSTACRSNNRQRPGARLSNSLGAASYPEQSRSVSVCGRSVIPSSRSEHLRLWHRASASGLARRTPRLLAVGSEVSLWEPSLAQPCSAEGAFPLGHCSSRTCRSPAGSHRSCSSGDCRHRDNVCASAPHNRSLDEWARPSSLGTLVCRC